MVELPSIMGVKDQVFASNAERRNFYKLSKQWGQQYRLYHNLPFLNIFDTKNLLEFSDDQIKIINISDIEFSRLKKTSVDFTLCDEKEKPQICIDFDGYQEGYNVGTKYHSKYAHDSWKETIYDLKLKVAHGSLFPYFVFSSDQFKDLSKNICLTIVDGIIGEVFSKKAANERFSKGLKAEDLGLSDEEFNQLPSWDQDELIQDWAFGVEVEADFENNPIYKKSAELRTVVGFDHGYSGRSEPIKLPANAAFDKALFHGTKYTMDAKELGKIEISVLLPNSKSPYFIGITLADEIAHLLALDKLIKLLNK
jgi:hypothetical protein